MPIEVFLELTPIEFYEALWEKEKHEEDIVTAQIRTICETIRLQTWYLLNQQIPRGKRLKNPDKLMPFKWEKTKPTQTVEQMRTMMKALAGKK
jgi:hypothetical protein